MFGDLQYTHKLESLKLDNTKEEVSQSHELNRYRKMCYDKGSERWYQSGKEQL